MYINDCYFRQVLHNFQAKSGSEILTSRGLLSPSEVRNWVAGVVFDEDKSVMRAHMAHFIMM